jgi:hypothetical protein
MHGLSGDILASKKDVAVIKLLQTGNQAQQGCFAAPGRPQQTQNPTLFQFQGYIPHRRPVKGLFQVVDFQ